MQCPARGKKCKECGNIGHFAARCKTKVKPKFQQNKSKRNNSNGGRGCQHKCGKSGGMNKGYGKVHAVGPTPHGQTDDEGEEYAFQVNSHVKSTDVVKIKVDEQYVDFIVDSGASVNIVDKNQLNELKENKIVCKSEKKQRKLYSYGAKEPLPLMGKFTTTVTCSTQNGVKLQETEIFVLDGEGPPLLGRETARNLGILKLDGVNAVNTPIFEKYPECFDGIGKLKDFQLKLHVNDDFQPVAQSMYRIPYSMRQRVSDKIDELENLDIVEKVTTPTEWVSPVIVVPKPDGDVRLCVDMRRANEAIIRERHPIPTVDEILMK